jgi:two-component system response regulator
VLVVDDDEDVRTSLRELLGAEGFEVHVASDGVEALAVAEYRAPFHAVVCDLAMPRLDGAALVRHLRRRGHEQVVVILSARFDLLAEAADLGQIYALGKPVHGEHLVRILREALEERR